MSGTFVIFETLKSGENSSSGWLSEAESDPYCPSLSEKQRILGFMGCMGMGLLCFAMAMAYLPVLLISARKFALLYTLGSLFFISSFSLLYGPKKHFKPTVHITGSSLLDNAFSPDANRFDAKIFIFWQNNGIKSSCTVIRLFVVIRIGNESSKSPIPGGLPSWAIRILKL